MRENLNKSASLIVKAVGSKRFFWAIIILFVVQALWIAFSFRYPMLYDESFHFNVIKIYSHHLLPFITDQSSVYDKYGDLAHGNSAIYHYIISWPFRFIEFFTDNTAKQVILLRIINILMAGAGLLIFAKLFRKIGIKQSHINIGLPVFTLLPITTFVAATINYDNMLFLATAWFFICSVRILQSKKLIWHEFVSFIVVGCFASLVKFTFLPVFAISFVYLAAVLYRRHGKRFFVKFLQSLKAASKQSIIIASIALIVIAGIFSTVYLQNIVRYGSLNPSCEQTLGEKRCESHKATVRSKNAIATRDTRPLKPMPEYISLWTTNMINWTNITGARPAGGGVVVAQPLPIIYTVTFLAVFLSIAALLYAWRALRKNDSWYFLICVAVFLILVVFFENYSIYARDHLPYAIQPRYLLSIIPIVLVMSVVAAGFILRKSRKLKVTLLFLILLLFTQGGGLTTHILRSQDSWYWQNPTVIKVNHIAKKILRPIVKE